MRMVFRTPSEKGEYALFGPNKDDAYIVYDDHTLKQATEGDLITMFNNEKSQNKQERRK